MINGTRFDKDFFTKSKDNRQTRDINCGHYRQVANFVSRNFHGKKMIEAGCGMGWITKNLKAVGEDCVGFDIGQWATSNAVTEGIFQADLIAAANWDDKWEVAVCSNVFAYFEKEEVPPAIRGLKNLFTEYAIVLIQTRENIVRNWGEHIANIEVSRRTLESWDWWKDQFEKEGLIIGKRHNDVVINPGPYKLVPTTTGGRSTLFILEHAK